MKIFGSFLAELVLLVIPLILVVGCIEKCENCLLKKKQEKKKTYLGEKTFEKTFRLKTN